MRSTGGGVHERGPRRAVFRAFLHFLFNGFVGINREFSQTFHVDAKQLRLSDFEATRRAFLGVDEQVLGLFIVDFNHGEVDLKLCAICGLSDTSEDFLGSDGHDALISSVADH